MSQDTLTHKQFKLTQRRGRTRRQLHGTAARPRLSVHISHQHVSAQLIDDDSGRTLAYVTTVGQKATGSMTDRATWIGTEIAKRAQKIKIKKIIFDRGERRYHGRVKQLAEAARSGGLEF